MNDTQKLIKADELEKKAQELRNDVHVNKQNKQIQKTVNYRKSKKIDVYCSDDYAGLDVGNLNFYFGYEETICPIKSHKTEEDCDSKECERREWAFTVTKGNKEIMRIPQSKLYPREDEEPMFYLLAGIGIFLKRK